MGRKGARARNQTDFIGTIQSVPKLSGIWNPRIKEKMRTHWEMDEGAQTPLWDYLATSVAKTHSRMTHPIWNLHGRTPYEIIVAHWIGQAIVYYIIPKSGVPLVRSTVQLFLDEDKRNPAVTAEVADLDKSINRILKKDDDLNWNDEIPNQFEAVEPDSVMPDADDYDEETLDKWLSANVLLPHGDTQSPTTVWCRKRDHEGNPVGTSHPNPVLDTRVYEVEFEDGTQQEYAANLIATSIFAQVDDEGYEHILMDKIIKHKADGHAVKRDDMYIVGKNRNKHMRRTTKGWKLL
eukprot:scaffold40853_cov42-Attheya_sp.AAC.2